MLFLLNGDWKLVFLILSLWCYYDIGYLFYDWNLLIVLFESDKMCFCIKIIIKIMIIKK